MRRRKASCASRWSSLRVITRIATNIGIISRRMPTPTGGLAKQRPDGRDQHAASDHQRGHERHAPEHRGAGAALEYGILERIHGSAPFLGDQEAGISIAAITVAQPTKRPPMKTFAMSPNRACWNIILKPAQMIDIEHTTPPTPSSVVWIVVNSVLTWESCA